MICDENRLDFEELRRGMNTKWNVEVLEARDGIGGTCLPKDVLYVKTAAPEGCHLLDGARSVGKIYREQLGKGRGLPPPRHGPHHRRPPDHRRRQAVLSRRRGPLPLA